MRTSFLFLYVKLIFSHSNKVIKKKSQLSMFWRALWCAGWIPHPWDHLAFIGTYFYRTHLQFLSLVMHMELGFFFSCEDAPNVKRKKENLPAIPCSLFPEVHTQTVSSLGQKFWYSLIQVRAFQCFKTLRHLLNYKYPTIFTIHVCWREKQAFQSLWKRALDKSSQAL